MGHGSHPLEEKPPERFRTRTVIGQFRSTGNPAKVPTPPMARFANCAGDSVPGDVPIRDLEEVALGIVAVAEKEWRKALK